MSRVGYGATMSGEAVTGATDPVAGTPRRRPDAAEWAWRAALVWMAVFCAAMLLGRLVGEADPHVALILYVPWIVWILPLVLLWPSQIGRGHRAWLIAVFLAGALIWPLGFRPIGPFRTPTDLVVFTNNGGDLFFEGVRGIAARFDPDVLLLQEANFSLPRLRREFSDYHFAREDEYVLLSRWPIIGRETIYLDAGHRGLPAAARFVIEVGGRPLAVYNVHMPTPRRALSRIIERPSVLVGADPQSLDRIDRFWHARLDMNRELRGLIARDPLPVVVGGDFNMLPHGRLRAEFGHGLTDAQAAAGLGFGHTFPESHRRGLLALIEPWMRLDYLFAGPDIRVRWVRVAGDGAARQHLPVIAGLDLPE